MIEPHLQHVKFLPKITEWKAISERTSRFHGHLLNSAQKDDQAIKQYQKTLELYPNHPMAMVFLGKAYVLNGKFEDAIALLKKAVDITRGKSPFALGALGHAYGVAGRREEAQEILDEVLEKSKRGYFSPFFIVYIYTSLGDKDKAFEWLEKAYEEHDPRLFPLKTVADLRSLHTDLRWNALLKEMGLEK